MQTSPGFFIFFFIYVTDTETKDGQKRKPETCLREHSKQQMEALGNKQAEIATKSRTEKHLHL